MSDHGSQRSSPPASWSQRVRQCTRDLPIVGCDAPHIVFPWALVLMLTLTSAAQYAGFSSLGLLITRMLFFSPVETNNFWMIMGFVGFGGPVLGYFSDVFTPFGERRRPCLALGLILNGTMLILLSRFATQSSFGVVVFLTLLQTASEMLVFIPLNGMVVELCQNPARTRNIIGCCSHSRREADGANEKEGIQTSSEEDNDYTTTSTSDEAQLLSADQPLTMEEKVKAGGAGQALSMLVRSFGSLIGGTLQTISLTKLDPRGPMLGAGLTFLFLLVLIRFIPKHCTTSVDADKVTSLSLISRMNDALARTKGATSGGVARSQLSSFVGLLIFVFIYSVIPSATSIYYQFVSVNFWFSLSYLSATSLAGLASSIVACYVYQWKLAKQNQVAVFVIGCAAMSLGYVTNIMLATGFSKNTLHIPDHVFVAVDTVVVSFLSRVAYLPVLQIASSRCPTGFEAVIFELFTCASLGASSVAALMTTFISLRLEIETGHYERLWVLLVICAAGKWIPVLFLGCLPKVVNYQKKNSNGEEEEEEDKERAAPLVAEEPPLVADRRRFVGGAM